MARRRKSSGGRSRVFTRARGLLSLVVHRRVALAFAALAGLSAATYAAGRGVRMMRTHVERKVLENHPFPTVHFVDLPPQLAVLAQGELEDSLLSLLDGPWLDDRVCRMVAERLERSGWIAAVRQVRRHSDGRFDIRCAYRIPAVMIAHGDAYYLVDDEGMRLPGVYRADSSWVMLEGVGSPPPPPGAAWEGDDVKSGLRLLRNLRGETFAHQVAGIDVENYRGRRNKRSSHVIVRTHPDNGQVWWGSMPGQEIEENSVAQKLVILREAYRRTGRLDAGHPVIDVSTFPDRFTIPG